MAEEENTVHYSVKELLAEIKSAVDKMYGKLDGKADRSEVAALAQRIDHESGRIDGLERETEHQSRSKQENTEWRRYLWPLVLTLVLVGLGVVQLVMHR